MLDSARSITGTRYGVVVLLDSDGTPEDLLWGLTAYETDRPQTLPGWPSPFEFLGRSTGTLRMPDLPGDIRSLVLPELVPRWRWAPPWTCWLATHLTMLVRLRCWNAAKVGRGSVVEETNRDVAYGDGVTRQRFDDAGRPLVASPPLRPQRWYFPKEDFEIDLEAGSCTYPTDHTTGRVYRIESRRDRTVRLHEKRGFSFDAALGGC